MRRFWCSGDSTSKRVLDVLESFYPRLWKIIVQRIAVVEFRMYDGSGDGTGSSALNTMSRQVLSRRIYSLPYYIVFELIHYFTMWSWPLTLWPWPLTFDLIHYFTLWTWSLIFDLEHLQRINCDMWWNSVPNLNAIEQSAAELLGFQCLTLWPWTCFKGRARL